MDLLSYAIPVGIFGTAVCFVVLVKVYMSGRPYSGKERIPGKTVIVTGANTGIGKATAKELARRGGRVILACRDLKKAEHAKADIVWETGNENVIVKHLDLASMKSIHAFAEDINASEPRVDILINNAGVCGCPRMLTEDGFEMHIGVNHMGHFLLTMLLLDKLKSSTPSRIINVSSFMYAIAAIDFDDLNGEKYYMSYNAYIQSKLANILFTFELSKKLENTGVTVNSVHPGAVRTELQRHLSIFNTPFVRVLIAPLVWLFMTTPAQGAQTSLYCAVSAELEGVSGKYFSDCKEEKLLQKGRDPEAAKRLWALSEKWTKLA